MTSSGRGGGGGEGDGVMESLLSWEVTAISCMSEQYLPNYIPRQ
jgi:hypothetical protein